MKNPLLVVIVGCFTFLFCSPSMSVIQNEPHVSKSEIAPESQTKEPAVTPKGCCEICWEIKQPKSDITSLLPAASVKDKLKKKLKETAYLFISVEPQNADILLDGKYVGSGQVFWEGAGRSLEKSKLLCRVSKGFRVLWNSRKKRS